MKLLVISQAGGACPAELLNTIARCALPMLKGETEPIRFSYPDCTGLITTRKVYTTMVSFFGLIITAEVEHDALQHRIVVKMLLDPKLKIEDIDPPFDHPAPIWVSGMIDPTESFPSIEFAEQTALN